MKLMRIMSNLVQQLVISIIFLSIFFVCGCGGSTSGAFTTNNGGEGTVTLAWQEPATNEDGSSITDLAGYRVYYGEIPGDYNNVITLGNYSSCSISNLPQGVDIYFVVTAFDSYGNESSFSNEVSAVL